MKVEKQHTHCEGFTPRVAIVTIESQKEMEALGHIYTTIARSHVTTRNPEAADLLLRLAEDVYTAVR